MDTAPSRTAAILAHALIERYDMSYRWDADSLMAKDELHFAEMQLYMYQLTLDEPTVIMGPPKYGLLDVECLRVRMCNRHASLNMWDNSLENFFAPEALRRWVLENRDHPSVSRVAAAFLRTVHAEDLDENDADDALILKLGRRV